MYCPNLDDVTSAVLKLLPRGRAWQTNDGLPMPGQDIGFDPSAYDGDAFSSVRTSPSILWQYWRSFAVVLQFATQRMCDLRQEFWCQSINETRDGWMTEYGLPDACDPYPDLCTKVTAIGGTQCQYYASVVAKSGWSITCLEALVSCGSRAGFARAGQARAGRTMSQATLRVVVSQSQSPAMANIGPSLPPLAGRFRAGRRNSCGPDLSPLLCILARIVHAELVITVEVTS